MPLFLLANWKWIIPSLIAAALGVALMVTKLELAALRIAVAEQKVEAGKVLAGALQRLRDKENRDAENARAIDEAHKAEIDSANAGRADFERRLRVARSRPSCGNTTAVKAVDPVVSESPTAGRDDGHRENDIGISLRDAALELQRYAIACHSFATSVGR